MVGMSETFLAPVVAVNLAMINAFCFRKVRIKFGPFFIPLSGGIYQKIVKSILSVSMGYFAVFSLLIFYTFPLQFAMNSIHDVGDFSSLQHLITYVVIVFYIFLILLIGTLFITKDEDAEVSDTLTSLSKTMIAILQLVFGVVFLVWLVSYGLMIWQCFLTEGLLSAFFLTPLLSLFFTGFYLLFRILYLDLQHRNNVEHSRYLQSVSEDKYRSLFPPKAVDDFDLRSKNLILRMFGW